jgi:hypothetical protein
MCGGHSKPKVYERRLTRKARNDNIKRPKSVGPMKRSALGLGFSAASSIRSPPPPSHAISTSPTKHTRGGGGGPETSGGGGASDGARQLLPQL